MKQSQKEHLLIVAYNDCTVKTEKNTLSNILTALNIYIQDEEVFSVHVIECETGKVIIDF